jgi:hypothetical protein
MHSSHDIDHETAEHQSLSRFFDLVQMVLRQSSRPRSHDHDCCPAHNDTVTVRYQRRDKIVAHYHQERKTPEQTGHQAACHSHAADSCSQLSKFRANGESARAVRKGYHNSLAMCTKRARLDRGLKPTSLLRHEILTDVRVGSCVTSIAGPNGVAQLYER